MRWGMPTLAELGSAEENLDLCRRLGLDFVEINMNLPMFQPDALAYLPVCSDVFYTLHMDENFSPADFNPIIAEAWMETMRRTLIAAKKIGAPVINMHMSRGVYFTLPDGKMFLFDKYRSVYLDRMRRVRELCDRELSGTDLRICIENTGGYLGFQQEAIDLLLESRCFALTWDLGHRHKGNPDDAPFLYRRSDRLAHFHVHDADAVSDHLALGDGEIDLDEMLGLAKRLNAGCVLETKTAAALERSVVWLHRRGWM